MYGIPPPTLLSYILFTTKVQVIDEFLHTRTSILQELHHNLMVARNWMKTMAGQYQREVAFSVGDYVYLMLQPYQ